MISYLTTNSTRDRTPIENQNIKKVESPPSHQSSRCRSPLRVILGNVDINTRIDVKILKTKIQIRINLCHSLGEISTFQWHGNYLPKLPIFVLQLSINYAEVHCVYVHTQTTLTDLKLWPSKYKANNYWVANKGGCLPFLGVGRRTGLRQGDYAKRAASPQSWGKWNENYLPRLQKKSRLGMAVLVDGRIPNEVWRGWWGRF